MHSLQAGLGTSRQGLLIANVPMKLLVRSNSASITRQKPCVAV